MPQKLNKAGNMQNYVPAGNGDASGEYGDNANGSNKHFTNFAKPQQPTTQTPTSTPTAQPKQPPQPRKKRKQIENKYTNQYHTLNDNEEFKKDTLEMIKNETGYNEQEAKELQNVLIDYMSSDYSKITSGEDKEKVKIIDKGLNKMPVYEGEIYRGMSLADGIEKFENLKEGETIQMRSISSWTSKENVAKEFGFENGDKNNTIVFICNNNKSGVGVQHLSSWGEGEAEVLLPSNAKWKVKKVETQSKYNILKNYYNSFIKDKSLSFLSKLNYQEKLEDLEKQKDNIKYKQCYVYLEEE